MLESATLCAGSNRRVGGLTLLVAEPAIDGEGWRDRSPWQGMSGGPVFCRGALVAVVTDHHPAEGLGRLAAARLDATLEALATSERRKVEQWLQLSGGIRQLDVEAGALVRSAYREQLRDIAPVGGLLDREQELEALAQFCGGDESYVYWQAPPWAGKSALMASFASDPPDGVTVAAFFVTARFAGQTDSAAFTDAMIEQLSAIVGEDPSNGLSASGRDAHRRRLLRDAAHHVHQLGQRLILLVDGLDEDTGARPGSGIASIASLLPKVCLDGLKVIIAGRPHPPPPGDLPPDHPLQSCPRQPLAASPHASAIKAAAKYELDELLAGPEDSLELRVVGLLTASDGGLTLQDLEELTDKARYRIEHLLGGVFGRTVRGRMHIELADPQFVYLFAHETLREHAVEALGPVQVDHYRDEIKTWADRYRRNGWPERTPPYLLTHYPKMLHAANDIRWLTELAGDRKRHDRMLNYTGGDHLALSEIALAMRDLADQTPPDFVLLLRLARRRQHLTERNSHLPLGLPAVWALLGKPSRAEALARSISSPADLVLALVAVARVIRATDATRAKRIAAEAERAARNIADPWDRGRAFATIADAIAPIDPVRAEEIAQTITNDTQRGGALEAVVTAVASIDLARSEKLARSITGQFYRARALATVARATAPANPVRAAQIATDARLTADGITDGVLRVKEMVAVALAIAPMNRAEAGQIALEAEKAARTFTEPSARAEALGSIARALAPTEPARAERAAADAEQAARNIPDLSSQAWALVRLAEALEATDPMRAERITSTITDPPARARALANAIRMFSVTDPVRAAQAATDAECSARNITDPRRRAVGLTAVARRLAPTDSGRAEHLALAAEQISRTITDHAQPQALAAVARSLAATDPVRAERIAHTITDPFDQAWVLAAVARTFAATDPARAEQAATDAEQAVSNITDADRRSWTLVEVAETLAAIDPARAEQVAHTIPRPSLQALALAEVTQVLSHTDLARAKKVANHAVQAANSVADQSERASALAMSISAFTLIDQHRAKEIASDAVQAILTCTVPFPWELQLAIVGRAIAPIDPAGAEQIAYTLTDPADRVSVLAQVICSAATDDPVRLEQAISGAEQAIDTITDPFSHACAVTMLVKALAVTDPSRAERIARNISGPSDQARAVIALILAARGIQGQDYQRDRLLAAAILGSDVWHDAFPAMSAAGQAMVVNELMAEEH
jgi:hypothetical protein